MFATGGMGPAYLRRVGEAGHYEVGGCKSFRLKKMHYQVLTV